MFEAKLRKSRSKILCKILVGGSLLCIVACGGDPYLYDRTGFDEGARPVVAPNPAAPNATAPDYYRQSPYQYQQQNPYAAYPTQYQQYPQGAPYAPQYQGGGSRYYSNPYAIPAAPAGPGYYQRYDVDQYYMPPTHYNNIEQQKFSQGSVGNLNY